MTLLKRAAKDGKKFLNPVPTAVGGFSLMRKVLPLYLTNHEETEPKQPLGPFVTDTAIYATPPPTGLRVTWFGHSSLLIEIDGFRVLIDPVWDQRASPSRWLGPKRFFAPTMHLADLPSLDVVLISHDHYDHFGKRTLRKLATLSCAQHARWVTSLGVGKRLQRLGVQEGRITELDWTESVTIGDQQGLTITSWPARHFSGRGIFDRFKTLWASFVLEGTQHRIYFGADSGLWEGFAEIASRYNGFDLTLLEIGAYHPLWESIHLGPDGAAAAYRAMGGFARAGLLMPVHWGLFNLALHAWRQPIQRLLEVLALDTDTPSPSRLWLPTPGYPTDVAPGTETRSDWWK